MKIEEIIGSVLLRVTGGKATSDTSVHPEDIRTHIAPGINALMGMRIDKEYSEEALLYPNGLFVTTFNDINVTVNERGLNQIEFPKRPLSVRGARSVISMGAMNGKLFTRVYHDEGTMGAFIYKTRTDVTSFDVEGPVGVIYNSPADLATKKVFVKMIVHMDAMDDEDEVFVPSGLENDLIDIVYNMVMNQRVTPKDPIIDGKDTV